MITWLVHRDAPENEVGIPSPTHVWHRTTEQDVALTERTQAGLQSPCIHSSLTTYPARMTGDGRTAELMSGG